MQGYCCDKKDAVCTNKTYRKHWLQQDVLRESVILPPPPCSHTPIGVHRRPKQRPVVYVKFPQVERRREPPDDRQQLDSGALILQLLARDRGLIQERILTTASPRLPVRVFLILIPVVSSEHMRREERQVGDQTPEFEEVVVFFVV